VRELGKPSDAVWQARISEKMAVIVKSLDKKAMIEVSHSCFRSPDFLLTNTRCGHFPMMTWKGKNQLLLPSQSGHSYHTSRTLQSPHLIFDVTQDGRGPWNLTSVGERMLNPLIALPKLTSGSRRAVLVRKAAISESGVVHVNVPRP
jgi:hypothetical protein